MNKEEYLHELETRLKKHLPKSEINDILRDYGEYFEDGRRQNKSDTEISAKLGLPELIAQQFIEEYKEEKKDIEPAQEFTKMKESAAKSMSKWKEKVHVSEGLGKVGNRLKLAFSSVWSRVQGISGHSFSVLFRFIKRAVVLCCFLILEFIVFSILASIAATAISLLSFGIMGILGFICTFSFISYYLSTSGILFSLAVVCAGLLCGLLTIYCVRLNIKLLKKYWKSKEMIINEGDKSYV